MPIFTVGDGGGFLHALRAAYASRKWASHKLATDQLGSTVVDIPPGEYHVTDLHGLMGGEAAATKVRGLRFRGSGSDVTHIIFDPPEPCVMAYNRFWQNVAFEGVTFSTTTPGSTFLHSWAIAGSAPQEFTFTDVKWNGPWRHVINLQGTNNNSEFRFFGCGTSGMADDGAFLYVGPVDTSDQFLNYWFYGFKHWSTAAALVDMARGGHVHLFGVDASDWGSRLAGPGYLLNLRGNNHAHGVQTLTATGLRVEPKSNHAGLIYSEWADGNVTIQCDWSSQINDYTYGNIMHLNAGNTAGPVYTFHDSNLAGGVAVEYGIAAWGAQPRITFRNCTWRQRLTPTEAVTYLEGGAGGNLTRPAVVFDGCRNPGSQNPRREGAAVWDAVIGRGLVRDAPARSLMVQGVYGNIRDLDGASTVHLPVGAVITGCTVVGDTPGVWEVSTTETEPRIIATSNGNLPPHRCADRDQATVTVRATGVTKSSHDVFLLVEGYW